MNRRARILIVDDVEDNVFTLERHVRRFAEAETAAASNGRLALDQLRAGSFDLVLLDMQMPEMDGLAVLEQMKADMALRDVPVIMVSAVYRSPSTPTFCGLALRRRWSAGASAARKQTS
jgi:CheY-like chemotaxis protein